MMKMNEMIGSDFDGTLLKNGRISQTVRDRIRNFRKNGNYFVIVTGRSVPKMKEGIKKYNVDFFDFIICSNGAVLLDYDLHVAEETPFAFDEIKKITELYKDKDLTLSSVEHSYFPDQRIGPEERILAISFESETKAADRSDAYTVFQNGRYADIVPAGVCKSAALLRLSKKMHVQSLYTIGDGENDLDLLDCTPYSFSFAYCPDTVKCHAGQCCDTIEEVLDKILEKTTARTDEGS